MLRTCGDGSSAETGHCIFTQSAFLDIEKRFATFGFFRGFWTPRTQESKRSRTYEIEPSRDQEFRKSRIQKISESRKYLLCVSHSFIFGLGNCLRFECSTNFSILNSVMCPAFAIQQCRDCGVPILRCCIGRTSRIEVQNKTELHPVPIPGTIFGKPLYIYIYIHIHIHTKNGLCLK